MVKTGLTPTDELVRRAVIGDAAAFERLWDMYIGSLRAYIRTTIKNLDDFYVEDICSRSFQKAFFQIHNFDSSRSQFQTWLKVIARNTALDTVAQLRRLNQNYVLLDEKTARELEAVETGDADALGIMIDGEDRLETLTKIESLPSLYREVARLRLVEGLPYKEIAEATGLELNTVRTRIRRAKALLDK